jgi:hypothetical protein
LNVVLTSPTVSATQANDADRKATVHKMFLMRALPDHAAGYATRPPTSVQRTRPGNS